VIGRALIAASNEDVHDLAGLAEVNRYLFAGSEEREALLAGDAG